MNSVDQRQPADDNVDYQKVIGQNPEAPDPNVSDEDDVAGTPHPIPGGEPDSPALVSFAPDPTASEEDDVAGTPHPIPGGEAPDPTASEEDDVAGTPHPIPGGG